MPLLPLGATEHIRHAYTVKAMSRVMMLAPFLMLNNLTIFEQVRLLLSISTCTYCLLSFTPRQQRHIKERSTAAHVSLDPFDFNVVCLGLCCVKHSCRGQKPINHACRASKPL